MLDAPDLADLIPFSVDLGDCPSAPIKGSLRESKTFGGVNQRKLAGNARKRDLSAVTWELVRTGLSERDSPQRSNYSLECLVAVDDICAQSPNHLLVAPNLKGAIQENPKQAVASSVTEDIPKESPRQGVEQNARIHEVSPFGGGL